MINWLYSMTINVIHIPSQCTPFVTKLPSACIPPQNSTPGHFRSGCPCNLLPNFLSVSISEGSKYPATARLEKRPGDACPFERINLSRSSQRGFFGSNRRYLLKRQPIISAIEKEPPGWPEAAAIVPLITSLRALRTFLLIL